MAGVQETFMTYEIYDDLITLRLVQEACKMLGEHHFLLKILGVVPCKFKFFLDLCLSVFAYTLQLPSTVR